VRLRGINPLHGVSVFLGNGTRGLMVVGSVVLVVDLVTTTFFLGCETLLSTERPAMARWRERLFVFMSSHVEPCRPRDRYSSAFLLNRSSRSEYRPRSDALVQAPASSTVNLALRAFPSPVGNPALKRC